MRPHFALVLVVASGATLGNSCSNDNASHPPYSSPPATGGTKGTAGHGGNGGKKPGTGGKAGSGAGEAGASGAGQGGESPANGSGGTSGLGAAGVPFSGDMGSLAGTGGGGGAPGPGDAEGRLFIGPGGYDAASGTRDDPFGTLASAAAVAKRGNTIVFLAGNYSEPAPDGAVAIPDGVDIVADEPRLVSLTGSGDTLLDLAGDTHVDGIRFSGYSTVAHAASAHGSVTVTNSSFGACPSDSGKSVFEVGSGATVTLTGDASHDWGDCAAFAHVIGDGDLALDGGLLHFAGSAEPALFAAEGDGKLELSNLTASDGDRPVVVLGDGARATLVSVTLATLANNVVVLGDLASLDATNSDLSLAAAASAPGACVQSNVSGTSTLSLAHSLVHACRAGIGGAAPTTLSLSDTEFYAMSDSGLDLASAAGSTVTITACSFHDDGARAAHFGGGGSSVFHLTLRGSTIASVPSGFELDGDAGSSWDLGTLDKPGSNTFTATTSSLVLANQNVSFVSAVGNGWTPNVQAADADGHYSATGSGAVLEVTSGSGQNYTDEYGGTLRLAENP
jgi:hypothetical protein